MAIKHNRNIEGIDIGGHNYKVGQYADDTFLLLKGDARSLRVAIRTFQEFYRCSGLKLNVDKTLVSWLGRKRGSLEYICNDLNLKWTTSFNLLGIQFNSLDVNSSLKANLEGKLTRISRILQQYGRRNLTILGRVTVVKTLAIPQIVHILSIFPSPDVGFINKLNEMISMFVWNNKKGKINRNLLAQDYEEGGLKLTHIRSQIEALKLRWIRRYLLLENEEWTHIFQTVSRIEDIDRIFTLDPKSVVSIASKIKNLSGVKY